MTTGPAIDAYSIGGASNVVVVPSAPHRQVLEHAPVVVTHGGHGTVVKALAAGLPLVVLPHGRDQLDNAVRVASRGAGIKLKRTATASQIARVATTVLTDPAYRASATLLGAAIRHDADHSALIDELDALPTSV